MVDRLPEFQGPKYAGSFRRGDFADFHQRFSLVPRRCSNGRGCLRKELLDVRISYLANIDNDVSTRRFALRVKAAKRRPSNLATS